MKSKKFRIGLSSKICIMIILISVLVTGIVSYTNYKNYSDAVYTVHAEQISRIAKTIENGISAEEWQQMLQTMDDYLYEDFSEEQLSQFSQSVVYRSAYEKIQKMVDSLGIKSVSVFIPEIQEMAEYPEEGFDAYESPGLFFLMDFYPSEEEKEAYQFGDYDSWWNEYSGMADYLEIFLQIQHDKEDLITTEVLENGEIYLTDYTPVFFDQEMSAVIMVSGDAILIDDFIQNYLIKSIWIGLLVAAVLTGLVLLYFYFFIIKPLKILKEETETFIDQNTRISEKLSLIQTNDLIQDLAESFLTMEKNLNTYIDKVTQVTAEKERISTELSVATKIQMDMLPTVFPPFPEHKEFRIFASMDPAKEVGGDFYDFFLIDEDHLAMVIADVAGKGVPASLFMAISKSLIKNRAMMGGTPAEILRDVNNQLCDGNEQGMFVTVWMAILDLATGKGIVANAGHEHPIRKAVGSTYSLLRYRHSPAVAMMEDLLFKEHEFQLEPGDRLFVYTDGIPEAINDKKEEYGTERLVEILNQNQDADMEMLLKMVSDDVRSFAGDEPQFDDQTMLIFEFYGRKKQK